VCFKLSLDGCLIPLSDKYNIQFRVLCINICIDIRNGKTHNINDMVNSIQRHPSFNQSNRKRIREPLIMACYLKKRYEYYKTLMIYQLIKRMRNEFNIRIHESLIDMKIDVQNEINICFESLRRIFKM